jgi:hypothetical protein
MGTPQARIIFPLLASVALHGLQHHLKKYVSVFASAGKTLKVFSANLFLVFNF